MMSEKETYLRWLKKTLKDAKETLQDKAVQRILRSFFELIFSIILGAVIMASFQIHWLFIVLGITIILLGCSHGFYLLTHIEDH